MSLSFLTAKHIIWNEILHFPMWRTREFKRLLIRAYPSTNTFIQRICHFEAFRFVYLSSNIEITITYDLG